MRMSEHGDNRWHYALGGARAVKRGWIAGEAQIAPEPDRGRSGKLRCAVYDRIIRLGALQTVRGYRCAVGEGSVVTAPIRSGAVG